MASASTQSAILNKVLTKDEKSAFGIFFTPPQIIHDFYKHINDYLIKDSDRLYILEPSCGSCEFIDAFDIHIDRKKSIDAIEFHPRIYKEISAIKRNDVSYIHGDFLEYDMKHTKKYDLIIGNPPYYVCDKAKVPDHFMKRENAHFEGRIQIFILFLLHALSKLKEDGILAFILPKSILNSAYYRKSRSYIYEHYEVLNVIDYGNTSFEDTAQETVGLIIRNRKHKYNAHIFSFQNMIYFTYNKSALEACYTNSTTLYDMGFRVKTGRVVWNEHKSKLSNDSSDALLLYNTNIGKGTISIKDFKNDAKKQYIKFPEKVEKLPIIVCNRGNGNSKYVFNYAYIDEEIFTQLNIKSSGVCVENHLNIIYYDGTITDEIRTKMKHICEKLGNTDHTKKWSSLFLGNNGCSKSELESLFPIPNSI